jgi:hypothetical protein
MSPPLFPARPLICCWWPSRPEGRSACALRLAKAMGSIDELEAEPGEWSGPKGRLPDTSPLTLAPLITQNRSDTDGKPIENLGWSAWLMRNTSAEDTTSIRANCGGWDVRRNRGNSASVTLSQSRCHETSTSRTTLVVLIEAYDAELGWVCTDAGSNRALSLKLPAPPVDWMVYLRAHIPASEFPAGVHAVEHVAGGTLVTLSKTPIDISKPDDLALVEAVEPVIRRHLPPEPPKPTVQGGATKQ